ncbi:hyaluronan and proteoglycan link protein 2 isoform X2 [Sander lucioperca]|uniref:hyaluronan and proteoglycan link protein 2 isoform X2 n=1 Tax=Sander lucioperca TaxID=283035 RepID=UPI00125DA3D6|nr:hyaluronan and proteoglycan link protein 2 isoform X2 [Sander lucioperca]
MSEHLHLFNFTGAGGVTPFIMNCAVILLLTSSCFTWSSAIYTPNREAPKKLKYLLEPPVYAEVVARRGENSTLPCILRTKPSHYKVKWTKLESEHVGRENIIMISNAHAFKPYGHLGPRASLRKAHTMDASLQLSRLELEDGGTYRCELVNGIEDESVAITLRIEGVVFPYQSKNGRYKFTFHEAKEVCAEQDGTLASYNQLFRACLLPQRGQRVWTGAMPVGSVMGPFITPLFIRDPPVEESCSPAFAVMGRRIRPTIGSTLSASPRRHLALSPTYRALSPMSRQNTHANVRELSWRWSANFTLPGDSKTTTSVTADG